MAIDLYEQLTLPDKPISISKEEGEFIYSFLKEKGIKKTIETGLAFGCSTAYIISATLSPHYAIDPFPEDFDNLGLKNIKKLKLEKYLRFEKDFSHNVLPRLLKNGVNFDFAFIDGDHKFDGAFIDFYYIDLLLNQKGYVLFHDTWLRSIQLVTKWIETNKPNYILVKTPLSNLRMFQKIKKLQIGESDRRWNHFKEFYIKNYSIKKLFDKRIGQLGLFLKEHWPKLYLELGKQIKWTQRKTKKSTNNFRKYKK